LKMCAAISESPEQRRELKAVGDRLSDLAVRTRTRQNANAAGGPILHLVRNEVTA
jgi:hypothetical protein